MSGDKFVDYFLKWENEGYSEEQIKEFLLSKGYPPDDVERAMNEARQAGKPPAVSPTVSPPSKSMDTNSPTSSSNIKIASESEYANSASSKINRGMKASLTDLFQKPRVYVTGAAVILIVVGLIFLGVKLFGAYNGQKEIAQDMDLTDDKSSFGSDMGDELTPEVNFPQQIIEDSGGTIESQAKDREGNIVYTVNYINNSGYNETVNYTVYKSGDVYKTYVTYSSFSSCNDGIMNFNETGIDCGGYCVACRSCTDEIRNGDEEGIDCGGDCGPCECSEYDKQNCTVPNGGGIQIRNCFSGHFSNWSGCVASFCNSNYSLNGSICVFNISEQNKSVNTTKNDTGAGNSTKNDTQTNSTFALDYVESVSASSYDVPANTIPEYSIDGNLAPSRRWSGEGNGAWIKYKFRQNMNLTGINIFFYKSNTRTADFSLEYSMDGNSWTKIGDYTSSGTTTTFETFSFSQITARYFRILGYGNTEAAQQNWTSIIEVSFVIPSGICVPSCSGKNCGSDGCDGSCGTCTGSCVSGVCQTVSTGKSYYVATTGSDSTGDGSIAKPWATMQKGVNSLAPGDTLYVRGGVYSPSATVSHSMYCGVAIDSKKGTSDKQYNIFAYPGETPILDGSNIAGSSYARYGICMYDAGWWHIKGLEIRNVKQQTVSPYNGGQGLLVYGGNDNLIENVVSHHNGGPGFGARIDAFNTHFLNCDAYSNYDEYTYGGDADGFDVGYLESDAKVTFTGCRAWNNSDDGFDMYMGTGYSGIVTLKDSWAWHNGYRSDQVTKGGDGCGFKYGKDIQDYDGVTRRISTNCIAYDNRQRGFSQETGLSKKEFYNCISYGNDAWGWSFYGYDVPDILRNNIAFGDGIEQLGSQRISDHNSWDSGAPAVTSADFESLDGAQLALPRKADGSLPDITFLHLKSDSDLINKGTNVGLAYSGTAPDLGAFEFGGTPKVCVANCTGKNCGGDGCGGSCGTCAGTCSSAGVCTVCTPSCSGKNCGSDGCGGSCGSCSGTCSSAGVCTVCSPQCSGKNCGGDGCGGSCGSCSGSQTCTSGVCTSNTNIETADYYVATTGSDSNPGTESQPFKTWQKAFNMAQAGDLVYIHGGVYYTSGSYISGAYTGVFVEKSGSSGNMIRVFAYPGETPILDCSGITQSGLHNCLSFENSNYWHLKGLTFRNTPAATAVAWSAVGVGTYESSNNIFENIVSSGHSGPGFTVNGNNNLYLNCDSHSNYDQLVGGENADGFTIGHEDSRYTNTFRGCRSYNNSDDGFDTYGFEGTAIYENCWAFNNGYGSNGDGGGFKLGRADQAALSTPQKVLKNCIVANTKGDGIDQSESPYITVQVYNSIVYKAGSNGFLFANGGNTASVFKNNIEYKSVYPNRFQSNNIQAYNSWQVASVDDGDFVSLDASQLLRPRKSDGSLPDITFLHLASGSDMIDKGTNVGIAYSGNAPDLGPFETGGSAPICTPSCSGKTCGSDGCDGSCGSCSSGQTCNTATGTCTSVCTPETNSAFCLRLGKQCGSLTANDNCGASRTVSSCGTCSSGTCNSNGQCTSPTPTGAIIIDHTTTDITQIPASCIEKAKALTFQYAHRSDGNNILEGMNYVYNLNNAFKYAVQVNSLPSQTSPIRLRIMDGNPPMDTYQYADYYWQSADGREATEANWESGKYSASMWSWCSELNQGYLASTMINSYLSTMNSLEADHPNIDFVYMTAYQDYSDPNIAAGNEIIRDYANNNNKILYDFEDIGKYDPDGGYHSNANRACSWCSTWCSSHTSYCANLPSTCSHTHPLLCAQRSKAYWWMMARLAGWDGNPEHGC